MSRIRGLELLFNLQKRNIRSKADCVVIALHCMLIDENLTCVGIGEDFRDGDCARSGTDLLPDHWNDSHEEYTLRYMSRDSQNRCLMKIIYASNILHVNVVVNEEGMYGMSFIVDQYITDEYDEYSTAYARLDELINRFQEYILDRISEHQREKDSGSSERKFKKSPGPKEPPESPRAPRSLDIEDPPSFPIIDPNNTDPPQFPRVGNQDRDPLGRGQGSMHFDPSSLEDDPAFTSSSRGRRPKTSIPPGVPPGARFDPYGPTPGPNRGKPNPDHYKPPDTDDDDVY